MSCLASRWRRQWSTEEYPVKHLLFIIKLQEIFQCCQIIREGREKGVEGRGQREGEEQAVQENRGDE